MSRTLTSEYEGIHVENQHYKIRAKSRRQGESERNTVRSFIQKYSI